MKQKESKFKAKNEKAKNKKGITLISLIVTIIVLLLLTGIPIVMMVGEDGIIQKSHEAKAQVEQAEEQKELDLKLSEYVLEKETTDIEIGDFVDRLEKEGKVKSHTQNDDGSYDVETDGGYSAEIKPDFDNPGDTVTNVEGKKDELPPKITLFDLKSTTNSITVNVKVNTREKETTIKCFYKENKEDEYKEIDDIEEVTGDPEVAQKIWTIQELTQKTVYDIKIETTNDRGTTTEEKSIETKEMPSGTDKNEGLEFANLKWNEKTHKASIDISKKNKTTDYKIWYEHVVEGAEPTDQYKQLGEEGTVEDLSLNDKVYAKLWDGTNFGAPATITITDKKAPIIVLAKTDAKTSEITTHVTARDLEAGLPNEVEFKYYIKLKNEPESKYVETVRKVTNAEIGNEGGTRTEDDYTFTDLKQNTVYNIKVEITDIAGNKGIKTITVKTPIIPGTAGGNNTNGKDTDKDGKIDAWDTNGDGQLDAWDTNKDGNADSWDKNGNGKLDDDENANKHPEQNNNGRDENGGKDTNGDGVVDTWDTDGDGKDDAKDTDGDGNADEWLDPKTREWTNGKGNDPEPQDTNGDGKPDRWVDPDTGEDKAIDTSDPKDRKSRQMV